jgi:hypothetical protein
MNTEKMVARNCAGNWLCYAGLAMMLGIVAGIAGCASGHKNIVVKVPEFVELTNGQQPSVVIGQPDMSHVAGNQGGEIPGANTLDYPQSAMVSNGRLLIADSRNNRILGYNHIPTVNNASADFVVGQVGFTEKANDFTTDYSESSKKDLYFPRKASEFAGANNRARLLVADSTHSRVLTWVDETQSRWALPPDPPNSPLNGFRLPDMVIGQPDDLTSVPTCSRVGLGLGLSSHIAGGKLFVADSSNNRVLIWNAIPYRQNTPADVVLGQGNFTSCSPNAGGVVSASSLNEPEDVWSDGTRLIVADNRNNRVLIWNSIPTANAAAADVIVGQLTRPSAVGSNGVQLFVGTPYSVMVFNSIPTSNVATADVVIGEPDASSSGINPRGVFPYHNLLFVSDAMNNRVLIFKGRNPYVTDLHPSAIQ